MVSTSQMGSSGTIEELKGKAKQTFDTATDRMQEVAGDAKQQIQDAAGNVKGAVDQSLKDQPLTTLLMAAAVGFVIGAIWKS